MFTESARSHAKRLMAAYMINQWVFDDELLAEELALAEQRGIEKAEQAFKDAYSQYDDPLIGVMHGIKAIRALAGK